MSKPPSSRSRHKTPHTALPEEQIVIERLDDSGLGTGRLDGKEIVVAGALPGERVAVSVERAGRGRSVGRLRRVLSPSPERVPSPCPQAGSCEECPLVALRYDAQLRYKEHRVHSALEAFSSLREVRLNPVLAAEHPLGYRTSARLVFTRVRGKIRLGFHRRGTSEVTPIGACPLLHPLINRIATTVCDEVQRQDVYLYNPLTRRGLLRYLLVAVNPAQQKAMVTFVTAERNFREAIHLAKWLTKKVPEVVSVQQNVNTSSGGTMLGRETIKILGVPDLLDQMGEVRLRVHPASQLPAAHAQGARLFDLVRQWARLTAQESALDLYCGSGALTLHLAKDAGMTIGIEAQQEPVREARENARLNAAAGVSFVAGDPAEVLHDLCAQLSPGGVAVVNAPRAGCDKEVLASLPALEPRAVIYIASDPRILARDLDALQRLGYRAEEVQPVDLHPQTPRIDAAARLVKRRSP